jgi:Ca2+-binding EF-hand superfamily protein
MSIEEAAEMRNPPPKSADADQDGNLSNAELYAYYSDGQSPSSSSDRSTSERESAEDRGPLPGTVMWDGELPRERAETDKEWPSELADKDRNGDGMVSLAEFDSQNGEDTTDSGLREGFARWDVNHDGYITRGESATKGRSERGSESSTGTNERSNSNSGGSNSSGSRRSSGRSNRQSGGRSANSGSSRETRSGSANTPKAEESGKTVETAGTAAPVGQTPPNSIRYSIFDK